MRRGRFIPALRQLPHWLALAAVLVQLIASFGHIHAEDYRFLVQGHGATTVKAGDVPTGRSGPFLAPDIDCAICASAQILGTGALPDFIAAPLPLQHAVSSDEASAAFFLIPPRYVLFVTRGPPLI